MLTNYYRPLVIEEKIGSGFSAITWDVVGYYKGFIQPVSGRESYQKGKGGEDATHRLYTAVQTPCKYGYRVSQDGNDYIMLYANQVNGISGTGHHKEIILGRFQ